MPLFNSCSSHSKSVSLTATLEQIDIYLSLNDTKEAYKLLKEAEKNAFTYFERLGVYKRYVILGDDKKAESVLSAALKEFPDNVQVRACYVSFLLDQEKYDKAVKTAEKLADTEYSSLYAESSLRMLLHNKNEDAFKDPSLISVYLDAWKGSGDSVWLRNAALLYLKDGKFEEAGELFSENISGEKDVLFWQKVLYDGKDFVRSAIAGEAKAEFSDRNKELEHLMLLSDCYHLIHDEENECKSRDLIIADAEKWSLIPDESNDVLAKTYMNNVLYCLSKDDVKGEYEGINYLLSVNPCYVPALALYVQHALDYQPVQEDKLMADLRSSGLKTLQMEENDSRPRATVDVALYKIDRALEISDSPALRVLKHYTLSMSKAIPEQQAPRIWEFLEENQTDKNTYPEEVGDYAVDVLIKENSVDTAELIFKRNMTSAYGENFDPGENPSSLRKRELVYAAWFACRNGDIELAEKLYDYLNNHYAKDTVTLVNLAVIYAGSYREEKAVDLLSEASSIAEDSFTKSEILYRTGKLSDGLGDRKNAIRSLQYALQLNPGNNKARLLLRNILE
ncbi:lipopolysaccharide assembly protein LapB [Treponema sp.]|uniref:tetratricopeptide repeat protein n=1 Tax=Treponema sp. TaxID=166 RepID=UPI0025F5BA8F|nr:tetratricopeptide repeat protein [Treponema sp.]MCR5218569.1 hypothetical protein [Treponema sp.]